MNPGRNHEAEKSVNSRDTRAAVMYRQNLLPNKSLERDVCSASRCALRSTNAPQLRRSAARADPRGSAAEVADTGVGKAVSRRRQT